MGDHNLKQSLYMRTILLRITKDSYFLFCSLLILEYPLNPCDTIEKNNTTESL
jgi:hypothetical protein